MNSQIKYFVTTMQLHCANNISQHAIVRCQTSFFPKNAIRLFRFRLSNVQDKLIVFWSRYPSLNKVLKIRSGKVDYHASFRVHLDSEKNPWLSAERAEKRA